MRRLVSICIFLVIVSFAQSQILSIDKSHLDKDTSNFWAGAIDFQFLFNNLSSTPQQENIYIGFFSKLDVAYLSKKHAFLSINNFRYFKPGQGAFINSGVSHFNINWFRKELIKGNLYLGGEVDLNDHIALNVIGYYQSGYDNDDDLWRNRINTHLEIRDRLSKRITLKMSIDVHHDNNPIIPIPNWTYDFREGLSVHLNRL